MEVFSKGHYIHADFHGSASLKSVLPVLVPEEGYDGLNIQDGGEAMIVFAQMMRGQMPPPELAQARNDLLRYCEMDTLAMVKIWDALWEIVTD
jgi:hypothetical protein